MDGEIPAENPERSTAVPDLTGASYLGLLKTLHQFLQPETYLEIGTAEGSSFALAQCASIAVDPVIRVGANAIGKKPACHLFQMTSDRFFRRHDPSRILGQPIDFAFLDGLHYWEVLLRDFINTERHCRRQSVIALHDCVPTNVYVAERRNDFERRKAFVSHPDDWAGDVWKVLPVLRRFRPDLTIYAVDAPPTGLVMITGLDPTSTVLADSYFAIFNEFRDITLLDYGIDRHFAEIKLLPTGDFQSLCDVMARFSW